MTEYVAPLIIVDARLIVLMWKLIEYCMIHWTSQNLGHLRQQFNICTLCEYMLAGNSNCCIAHKAINTGSGKFSSHFSPFVTYNRMEMGYSRLYTLWSMWPRGLKYWGRL